MELFKNPTNIQTKMLNSEIVDKISYYDFVLTDKQEKWIYYLKYLFLVKLSTNQSIEILIPWNISIISLTIFMMELRRHNLQTTLIVKYNLHHNDQHSGSSSNQFYNVLTTHLIKSTYLIVSNNPIRQKMNYSLPLSCEHIKHINELTDTYLQCIQSSLPASILISDTEYVLALSIVMTTLNHLNYQTKLVIKTGTYNKIPAVYLVISELISSKL